MSKLSMVAAGAAGYVLGARAGRGRYEQIAGQAQRIWSNPKVQQASQSAQDLAREKAPFVADKLPGSMATNATSQSGDSDSWSPGSSG